MFTIFFTTTYILDYKREKKKINSYKNNIQYTYHHSLLDKIIIVKIIIFYVVLEWISKSEKNKQEWKYKKKKYIYIFFIYLFLLFMMG